MTTYKNSGAIKSYKVSKTVMNREKNIKIRNILSVDLALRDSANQFFDYVDSLPENQITIDFTGIISISRSFAHQYVTRRFNSNKTISEVNIPLNISKMFKVVENPAQKTQLIDLTSIKPIRI